MSNSGLTMPTRHSVGHFGGGLDRLTDPERITTEDVTNCTRFPIINNECKSFSAEKKYRNKVNESVKIPQSIYSRFRKSDSIVSAR